MLKQITLPTVSVSALTDISSVLPPRANAEQLSAGFQIPYSLESAKWPILVVHRSGGPRLEGSRDIGRTEQQLIKDVYLHRIYSDGAVTANDDCQMANLD